MKSWCKTVCQPESRPNRTINYPAIRNQTARQYEREPTNHSFKLPTSWLAKTSVKQILRHFVSQLTILPVIAAAIWQKTSEPVTILPEIQSAMCQKIGEPVSHLARHAVSHVPMCQKTSEPVSNITRHSSQPWARRPLNQLATLSGIEPAMCQKSSEPTI